MWNVVRWRGIGVAFLYACARHGGGVLMRGGCVEVFDVGLFGVRTD